MFTDGVSIRCLCRRFLALRSVLSLLAVWLTGCASTSPAPDSGTSPRTELIYVVTGGWHTELGLPLPLISGSLATLRPSFPTARYLLFGWGARDYYMARDPGFGDLMRATVPGPAVVLVIPLEFSPEKFAGAANAFPVRASREGIERLSRFLWDDLAKDPAGMPRRVGTGPYPDSIFYASTGTYDLGHTCNTWTAEALHIAGLPVSAPGVVFAGQVLDQLRPLGETAPAHIRRAQ